MLKSNKTCYSYEQWLDFIFKHEVNIESPWYLNNDYAYDISQMDMLYLIRLFNAPNILLKKYSKEQINQGFWYIPSAYGFIGLILDPNINFKIKDDFISSIEHLFLHFFAKNDIGESVYMWWDSFITYCTFDKKDISSDILILKKIECLIKRLLESESPDIIESAKHGYEHIQYLSCKDGTGPYSHL